MLRIAALGPLEVLRDGATVSVPAGKPTELLIRLALEGGTSVRVDRLVEELWASTAATTRRNTVQAKVSALRRVCGADAILAAGDGYALAVTAADVDALALVGIAAIAGFSALGAVFDYPKILNKPTPEILTAFRAHETAVVSWFLVLVAGAALLAPLALMIACTTSGDRAKWIAGLGVSAAVVQVIGLSRWALFVPGISDDALDPAQTEHAYDRFHTLHIWLGTAIGETVGYALTAVFTVVVANTLRSRGTRDWLALLGYASGALIATGVLVPAGLDFARVTNFVGYVAWCAWLLLMAAKLKRTAPARRADRGIVATTRG